MWKLLYKNNVTVLRNTYLHYKKMLPAGAIFFFVTCSSLHHRQILLETTHSTNLIFALVFPSQRTWGTSSFSSLTNPPRYIPHSSEHLSTWWAVLGSYVPPTLLIAFLKKMCSCYILPWSTAWWTKRTTPSFIMCIVHQITKLWFCAI